MPKSRLYLAALISTALGGVALAQDSEVDPASNSFGKAEYSPYLDQGFPDRVYFGDTHLHTSYSTDAGMVGNRLGPEEAYRFARGEEVISSTGLRARLQRPLDFLVVSDHAENLGLAPMIEESNPDLLRTEFGRLVHGLVKSGQGPQAYEAWIEYRDGNYERSFTVSEPIDTAKIEAVLKDGVLRLTLPKAAPSPAARISVKAA